MEPVNYSEFSLKRRYTLRRLTFPGSLIAATPEARLVRAVVDTWYGGSYDLAGQALGHHRARIWQFISGRRGVPASIIRQLRRLRWHTRDRLLRESLRREAEFRGRLELIDAAIAALPDPDQRPYEQIPGPRGGARTRNNRQDRKLRAERRKARPPRSGAVDLLAILEDDVGE